MPPLRTCRQCFPHHPPAHPSSRGHLLQQVEVLFAPCFTLAVAHGRFGIAPDVNKEPQEESEPMGEGDSKKNQNPFFLCTSSHSCGTPTLNPKP